MASAAEQMAANLSWGAFGKAKDLQNRILFALGLLIVYRLATFIPIPGIDGQILQQLVALLIRNLGCSPQQIGLDELDDFAQVPSDSSDRGERRRQQHKNDASPAKDRMAVKKS